MLHELQDISEVKHVKASRDGDSNPTRIRLVMLLHSIKLQPKPIVKLTDFSMAYQSNKISLLIDQHQSSNIIESLKYYCIKSRFNPSLWECFDQNVMVLLRITSEVYNGKLDLKYVLKDVNIININPQMVLDWDLKHQKKVKLLYNELKKRGFNASVRNKIEFDSITNIITPKREEQEQEQEPKKQKIRYELEELPSLQINPLFVAPENSHSQISNTQIYDLPDTMTESNYEEIKTTKLKKLSKEDEGKTMNQHENMIASLLVSDLDTPEPITQSIQLTAASHQASTQKPTPTKKTSKITNEFSDTSSDTDNQVERSKVNRNPNAIGDHVHNLTLEPDEKLDFLGYVLGIEPQNFNVIGRSYKELLKATNFRIYISNVQDLKVFKVNRNCLCLEFRSKEKILEFLGYESLEDAIIGLKYIKDNLERLNKNDRAFRFQISRKRINLSNGQQQIWELEDTLEELLNNSF